MCAQAKLVKGSNISVVWGEIILELLQRGVSEISPLVVDLEIPEGNEPEENPEIRKALDDLVAIKGLRRVSTVGSTIFPRSLWNPNMDRHDLFRRYSTLWPRIHSSNPNGTYFNRLIDYPGADGPINQLDRIIDYYRRGLRRRTGFLAQVFSPDHDQTRQPRRGFPCIQQMGFFPNSHGGLQMNAVLAMQYVLDRGYGNYLGLCHLGRFMANEMDLRFERLLCIVTIATLGTVSKRDLESLGSMLSASEPLSCAS